MKTLHPLLLLLPLLLAACDGGTPASAVDLYEAEAMVKRAKAQTEEAAQVTRQAVAQETRQVARTREASIYEMQLIDKQIEGTAIAYSIGATVAAGTEQAESARATERAAAIGTATAWPQTAVPLQATQAAIAASAQYVNARADLSVAADVIKFIAAIALVCWTIATVVKALTNRYRVANTVYGVVAYDRGVTLLTANTNPNKPVTDVRFREIPDVVSLNRSGTVLASAPMSENERIRRNLINVLKAAIVLVGEDAQQLPRWDKIKQVIPTMTSEKMQGYIDYLEQMDLVEALPSRGTFTVGGRTLGVVKYELETEQARIPDLSPAD